jgi:hypothetical protein
MSWHFSQALVEDYLRVISFAGGQYARSRSMTTAEMSSQPVRTMDHFRPSLFGMTLEPLTAQHGEDVLTWYQAGFPVNPTPPRLEAALQRTTYGRKCGESWQRQLPGTYLPKTRQSSRSITPRMTSDRWVTKPTVLPLARRTWARTICGEDIGYVHTPTTKANYLAPSMQKWESCRNFLAIFGYISPLIHEHLMGWPIGWSDLSPLETDKFRAWPRQRGVS